MARVRRVRLRPLSCQDKAGSSGVGVSLVLQGHDSGGEKECGRRRSKVAPKARFRCFSSAALYGQATRGAVWRCGGARRLCVRCGFHRDGGCGDLSIGGGRIIGPALPSSLGAGSILRCASWHNCAARCRPKKRGACLRNSKAKNGVASPGGVGSLLLMRRPSRVVRSWGYRIWQLLYAH